MHPANKTRKRICLLVFVCITNERTDLNVCCSKGWYVEKLKEKGIRYIDGRKFERYKANISANMYYGNKQKISKNTHIFPPDSHNRTNTCGLLLA
ncbi:YflJ family protein [Halalkalibacter kiskunsagensis]|uniref:YflJ family protein n=1 Tax=Halalkalibacter kiskunsagensis TaxID=1548599 RepID=A0ABV6KCW3_9BACI